MLSRTTYLNIAAAVLALMLGGPVAHGDDAKSGDRPAGWDKGKKEGWQGSAPPGLEKRRRSAGTQEKQEGGAGKETAERKPDAKETAPGTPDKKDTGGKPEKKKDKKEKKEKKQKDTAPK